MTSSGVGGGRWWGGGGGGREGERCELCVVEDARVELCVVEIVDGCFDDELVANNSKSVLCFVDGDGVEVLVVGAEI